MLTFLSHSLFEYLDWAIVALYAIGTLVLGWWFGREQKTTKEYFVGSGGMNSLLIGVSLFATLLSTISYLSMPGEAIGKGPAWLVILLAYPLIYFLVGYVLLPVYMKHRVTSAYELLEEKLGRETRLLGAILFLALRLVWMSTLIYFAASALATISGLDAKWEPLIVAGTGLVAVAYTSLGGLRAVVITDLLQTILLYGGAVLVIVIVSFQMGGFGWFPTEWHANWDHQPVMSFDPSVRITMVSAFLSMLIWNVCTLGGDQTSVQRFMATSNAVTARRSLAAKLIVGAVVMVTLFLAGFALLGYYEANPGELTPGLTLKSNADKIFPLFIANGLPPVVSGLVISALLAAAMSSVDSGVNSITAVVMTDFLPSRSQAYLESLSPDEQKIREKRRFTRARMLAFAIGAFVIASSSLVKFVPGNITAVTGKTVNLLTAPIFCLFFFALFVKNAKASAALLGCVSGIIVAVLIAFSGPIFGYRVDNGLDPVSFMWMSPATLLTNIAVGWIACYLLPADHTKAGRVWKFVPLLLAGGFVLWLATIGRPSQHVHLNADTREQCAEVLRQGMQSDEFWPSIHAAEGLTIGGYGSEVQEYLAPKLAAESELDDQQRCGVARELVRAGDLSKVQILIDILNSEDDFGHVHAAESLYKVSRVNDGVSAKVAQDRQKALRQAFDPSSPQALRRMSAAALGRLGDPQATEFLRSLLESDDVEDYRIGAWVLGRIGTTDDIKPIRARLEDAPDPLVRAFLEHALAALGDSEGLKAMHENLKSEDPKIRTFAATFAGDARAISAAPQLLQMLKDPDLDTRLRAAQSLLDLSNR